MKISRWIVIGVIIILGIGAYYYFTREDYNAPVNAGGQEEVYTVETGDTPESIANDLEERHLIKSAKYFENLFIKNNGTLYANTYLISPKMTASKIYQIITNKTSNIDKKHTFLIFEGEQLEQIAKTVSTKTKYSPAEIIKYWDNKEILKKYVQKYSILDKRILTDSKIKHPLEGYLYPATYPIKQTMSLDEITNQILKSAQNNYGQYLTAKNPYGLSLHDSLSLASIVERETMRDIDKAKVAGVFYNRLYKAKEKMPIQSDITVMYAMNKQKDVLLNEDLKYDSPYNTYLHAGIPPGAIASPSLKSLDAVYNPEKNDYYYFFAKQDTGEVLYSKTLAEHEKISEKYAWK